MTLRLRLALAVVLAAIPLLAGAAWLRRTIETRAFEDAMREFALATMDAGARERCEADPSRFGIDGITPRPPGPPMRRGPGSGAERGPGSDRGPGTGHEPDVERGPAPERSPGSDRASGAARPPGPDRTPGPARVPGPDRSPTPFRLEGPPSGLSAQGTRLWAYRGDFTSANARAPAPPLELVARLRDGAASASSVWQEGGRDGRRLLLETPWPDGPCAVLLVERVFPRTPGETNAFTYAMLALVGGLLLAVLLFAGPLVRRIRRLTGDVTRSAASHYASPVPASGGDELGLLARAFNEAGADVKAHIERLEARERTLREFVSNTAHDVAIPLTVLQGHLVAVREAHEAGRPLDEVEVRGAVEESHYIACLLQNLASVARLEASAGALDRRAVDMNALLERVVSRHTPVARGASIALEHAVPAEPLLVSGDVTLLEQAVSNVVHNAIRYNRSGGHVAAVLSTAPGDPTRFELRVVDDGPGIPADELPRVLERAFRGRDARTRSPHGAGLGLHIADDVMRRHGFAMTLARPQAGGLEVVFTGAVEAPRQSEERARPT